MSDMFSSGSAFPVELPRQRPPSPPQLGFAAGVAVGLIVAAIAAQIWLAFHLAPLAGTWAAFAPGSVGRLSDTAASDAWRCGVPAVTTVALAALLLARRTRARWYAVVAAVAIALVIATYLWAMAPWTDVAGAIR